MATDIVRMYACMHPAEQGACRSMANAYRAGINRPEHVIKGFFLDNLPAAQFAKRYEAWRFNFRMTVFFDPPGSGLNRHFRPNRIWCQELGDAFTAGTIAQLPPKCLWLVFYNSPDT